jgi:hypothetical protein
MRCAPERHHAAASKRRGVYDSVDAGERLQVKRIVVKRCCWCPHHKRVVQETGTGTLDFYWRITDLVGGSPSAFRLGNFNSAVFDANYYRWSRRRRPFEHYLQLYGHQKYGQNDFSVLLRQGNISASYKVQMLPCSLMCIIFNAWT